MGSMEATPSRMPVRRFSSHDEADLADDEYYAALTPDERVRLMIEFSRIFSEAYGVPTEGFRRVYRIIQHPRS